MANATTASVNDAAAAYYNPAAMAFLPGYTAKTGVQFVDPMNEFAAAGVEYPGQNRNEKTANTTFTIPHVYVAKNWEDSGLALGFGMFSNFGTGASWSNYSSLRYVATDTQLRTSTYNVNVAKKLGDIFSAAIGVDFMTTDARFDSMYPFYLFEPGAADGYRLIRGTGTGWGFNGAILLKPLDSVNIGLTYRSQIKTTVSGGADILHFPGTLGSLVGGTGGNYNSGADVDVTYPDIAVLGIAWKATPAFTLEADADYTGWASYDQLTFKFSKPLTLANGATVLPSSATQKKDWKNVVAFRAGASYSYSGTSTCRLGYYFDPTPVPDATFDPRVPDADRNVVSIGWGYKAMDNFTLDASFSYLWTGTRSVSNKVGAEAKASVNGDYKSTANIFGLSAGYKF
jgi:long-chain fatty acid transport protein